MRADLERLKQLREKAEHEAGGMQLLALKNKARAAVLKVPAVTTAATLAATPEAALRTRMNNK